VGILSKFVFLSFLYHFSPILGKLGVYDADGDGDFDVDDAKVLLGKYTFIVFVSDS
jgi:hypothetical protein